MHMEDLTLPRKEKWVVKLAEMTKLTALIREKILIHFNDDWKPLLNFVRETEKMKLCMTYGFDD